VGGFVGAGVSAMIGSGVNESGTHPACTKIRMIMIKAIRVVFLICIFLFLLYKTIFVYYNNAIGN
jgi:hypothetical protein